MVGWVGQLGDESERVSDRQRGGGEGKREENQEERKIWFARGMGGGDAPSKYSLALEMRGPSLRFVILKEPRG